MQYSFDLRFGLILQEEDEEAKYKCEGHEPDGFFARRLLRSPRSLRNASITSTLLPADQTPNTEVLLFDRQIPIDRSCRQNGAGLLSPRDRVSETVFNHADAISSQPGNGLRYSNSGQQLDAQSRAAATDDGCVDSGEDDEPIWRRRETLVREQREMLLKNRKEHREQSTNLADDRPNAEFGSRLPAPASRPVAGQSAAAPTCHRETENLVGRRRDRNERTPCNKHVALMSRREIVVEWQTMALVIDRLLFWIFLMATVAAYVIILFVFPYSKPKYIDDKSPMRVLRHL